MRFSIRDLLWLMVVAAIGVCWWIDHREQTTKNYRTEMIRWRFRAESLKAYVEKSSEKVTFLKNNFGTQEVTVEGPSGYSTSGMPDPNQDTTRGRAHLTAD